MAHEPCRRIVPGADTAIVFIHGIVGTPDHFHPLLPLVPPQWSTVNLLLPGHGGSVSDFSRSSMATWRRYVAGTVEELLATHRRLLLVGHSMGTLFCIDEALRHPDRIEGLFLLAAPLRIGLRLPAVTQALQVAFGIPGRSEAARAAAAACSICTSWRLWEYTGWIPRYAELFAAARQGRQQIGQVSVPTVAVQSGKDEMVSPWACRHLERAAHVTLHILPASRHFYYPPKDLEQLQMLFSQWITQKSPSA